MTSARIESLARQLARRDADRTAAREQARKLAGLLHAAATEAVSCFARSVCEEGAPHLDLLRVGPVEPDDKSVRAFQFRMQRGRHHALVVSKDRGEVMLVGPFKRGRKEEPCRAIHLEPGEALSERLETALEDLLAELITQAFQK